MDLLWIANIAAVFVLCVVSAGFLIPQILLIAYRRNLFDEPDERKIHKNAVPRLGGIAFTLVIFFSLAFILGINLITGYDSILIELRGELETIAFCICSIMILYIVGIADDLIGVRYKAKFIVQFLCGIMIIAGGLELNNLNGLLWLYEIPEWASFPLTIFAIIFIINSINLIDGIDGLASGLCSVAFITYGAIFLNIGEYLYAIIAFANLGVLLPFFYYNVFGNVNKHRKIFMGDTGSLTIGLAICILSLKILDCAPNTSTDFPNPFVVAFAPMIIPCFDVVRVYMHRMRNGNNPFLPDKNHLHHKFLNAGMQQRMAMITIISISFALIVFNCAASIYVDINLLFIVDAILVTTGNLWLSKIIKNKK